MKTIIHYSTKITASIYTFSGNCYMFPFYNFMTLEEAKMWAASAIEEDGLDIPSSKIEKILFSDSETGELIMECESYGVYFNELNKGEK